MKRVDRGRSRRAFLWGLGLFVGLQLGLAAFIATCWPELRDPLYHDKAGPLKARTVGVHPRPLTVLTLGTSRTDVGIRTRILEEEAKKETGRPVVAYNFGVSGAGPMSRLVFLRRLLAEGVRPDVLFLEVLPATLTAHVEANEFVRLPGSRLSWSELDLVRRYEGPIEEARASWYLSWVAPWYQHRFVLTSRLDPNAVARKLRRDMFKDVDPWGQRHDLVEKMAPLLHQKAVEKARQEYQVRILGKPFQLSEKLSAAYREILTVCRQEGITAVVVCMPEGPTFRGWYSDEARRQIDGFLGDVKREYGVKVFDCRDWSEEHEFRDSHHLMLAGAERFSRRFAREVAQPVVKQRSKLWARQHGLAGEP